MRSLKTTAPLLLCCGMLLTGCQSPTVTKLTQVPPAPLPAELTTWQESPEKPPPDATQKTAALILTDFQEALADCRRKLEAVVRVHIE